MERVKKLLSNKKIIIPLAIGIVGIIIIAVIIGTMIHKQHLERLEEEWKNKPKMIGDVCINMMYYTKQVQLEASYTKKTYDEYKKTYAELEAFYKEIEEQTNEIDNIYKELKENPKTKSQKEFYDMFGDMATLNGKLTDVRDKYFGYYSMLILGYGKTANVLTACDNLQQYYVDNIKYKIVYSEDNKTIAERKEKAEKGVSSKKNEQYLKDKYGW